jgi:2-methylcitrate dehydratase PrpD
MDILDRGSCLSRVFSSDYQSEATTKDLGSAFGLTNISFKPYAACLFVHPVVDALVLLTKEHRLKPEGIQEVCVEVVPINVKVAGNESPAYRLEGKFSIQFAAAIAILYDKAGNSFFSDEMVRDTRVRNMMKKIRVTGNPGYGEMEATVSVKVREGAGREIRVTSPKGDPKNHLSFDEIQEKFVDLCQGVLPKSRIDDIVELVQHLEDEKNMAALARLRSKEG